MGVNTGGLTPPVTGGQMRADSLSVACMCYGEVSERSMVCCCAVMCCTFAALQACDDIFAAPMILL